MNEESACPTCGEEPKMCRRCDAPMMHVHFTTGEPPEWWHRNRWPGMRLPEQLSDGQRS